MITDRQPATDLKAKLLALATNPANVTTSIDAPELGEGEKLHFRRLSLGDRMALIAIGNDKETTVTERQVRTLALVLANAEGGRAFPLTPETQATDRQALDALPTALADRAFQEAVRLATGAAPTKEALDAGKSLLAGDPELRVLMNLAASWGQPASDVMRAMPADEWPLWLALDATTKLGPTGDDLRAGTIAAVTNNSLVTTKHEAEFYFPSLRVQITPRRKGERGRVDPGMRGFLSSL